MTDHAPRPSDQSGSKPEAFNQPRDFHDESEALRGLLAGVAEADFERPTRFKQWTINDILTHLHLWNWAVEKSIVDQPAFKSLLEQFLRLVRNGTPMRSFEDQWLGPVRGRALQDAWTAQYRKTADVAQSADPRQRTPWVGPDMSIRSSITARLMETWAHGQAIYDLLGVERVDADRIRNIAVLGINTFEWTFKVRRQPVPALRPHVRLTAPSGAAWTWNEPSATELIEGSATEFCQVVTQTRNIADTRLHVQGDCATLWMSCAQCFAGPPQAPPAPGTRFREGGRAEGGVQ